MLHYIGLLVVGMIAGLVVQWLWKEAVNVGKTARKEIFPEHKAGPMDHLVGIPASTSINGASDPWSKVAQSENVQTDVAVPPDSVLWTWYADESKLSKRCSINVPPNGSKSELEFWHHGFDLDRPGHGTGMGIIGE